MPLCFRSNYGLKVAAIIDCYEIKIEKPSNLLAKAATWSQYKQSNTVKILIAIAPQGMTTFVSSSWGGRVSDKHLTQESGFLNKLPGDIVLADRGFDITQQVFCLLDFGGLHCFRQSGQYHFLTRGALFNFKQDK